MGFGAALIIGLLITPLFGKLSMKLGIIDYPSRRRFHLTSMPMLGGLAIASTFIIVLLIISRGKPGTQLAAIMASSVLLLILGLIDDINSISPPVKLGGQFVAGIILIAGGLQVRMSGVPVIDYVLTFIWVAGIVNCLNLLDNIDGLAGGTSAIAGCFFFIAALMTGKAELAVAAAVFTGSCLGFLFHNFHPASIFSGDAGSMFMGGILAAFGMSFMEQGNIVSHLYPGVILGMLIFDTGLVTVMRIRSSTSITQGGKDHTSHRLCYLGMSVQGAVTTIFIACALFGFAGVSMISLSKAYAILLTLALLFISFFCWYLMRNLYDYTRRKA